MNPGHISNRFLLKGGIFVTVCDGFFEKIWLKKYK